MVNKKAILKTLEAMIALFIVMTFLLVFIPQESTTERLKEPKGILSTLRQDHDFRSCIIAKNATCINSTIDNNLEDSLDFTFNISSSASTQVKGLPDEQVFSESLYIAGNVTNSTTTILRIFYWNKQ